MYAAYSKFSVQGTQNDIKVGQAVLELLIKKHCFDFLIHNLRTAWLTKVSIPFLNSLHKLV